MSVTNFEKIFQEATENIRKERPEVTDEILTQAIKNTFNRSLFEETANVIYDSLKQTMYKTLSQEQLLYLEFTSRLSQRWLTPLSLLDTMIMISEEICTDSIDNTLEIQPENNTGQLPSTITSLRYFTIMKLLSKIIVTAKEISYLLKGGFSDAAISRWRTLHEMDTVLQIFTLVYNDQDKINDIALRYNDSAILEQFKEYKKINRKDKNSELYLKLKKDVDEIIASRGETFYKSYEWARPLISKAGPIYFKDLESICQNNHLEGYYQQANYQIHGSPSGVYYSNGEIEDDRIPSATYVFGPSNYGLSLPGQLTAISLSKSMATFLLINPKMDHVIQANVFSLISKDILNEFEAVQQEILDEELLYLQNEKF